MLSLRGISYRYPGTDHDMLAPGNRSITEPPHQLLNFILSGTD